MIRKRANIPESIYERTILSFLAPIQPLLDDARVSDILINGPFEIHVERGGRLEATGLCFPDEDALLAAIKNMAQYVGKTIDAFTPLLDGRLPDGSRVQVTLAPCARRGPYVSIRRFRRQSLMLDDLITTGSLTSAAITFLRAAVEMAANLLVSGGTGAGKTTLLNVMGALIPADQRIVLIEDAAELQLQQPHVVSLESRPPDAEGRGTVSIRDLLRGAMRMRPDRIVIGEIRSSEALDLIQAMTSGHGGSMSTLHASSPHDALRRLETMAMMADEQFPLGALRAQICSAVGVVVQASRLEDGSRRVTRIASVDERLDADGGYRLVDVFTFARDGHDASGRVQGALRATGHRPTFFEEMKAHFGGFDESVFEPSGT